MSRANDWTTSSAQTSRRSQPPDATPDEDPPAYSPTDYGGSAAYGGAGLHEPPPVDAKTPRSEKSEGTFGNGKRRTEQSMTATPRSPLKSLADMSMTATPRSPPKSLASGSTPRAAPRSVASSSHARTPTSARSTVDDFEIVAPPTSTRSSRTSRGSLSSPPPPASPIEPAPQSTFERARQQVVQTISFRALKSFEQVGSIKVGVYARHAEAADTDEREISLAIARTVADRMRTSLFVFALLAMDDLGTGEGHFVLCASDPELLEKAAAFVSVKFMGRITDQELDEKTWLALLNAPDANRVESAWSAGRDEESLWYVLTRVAQDDGFGDPYKPPAGSRGIDELLASARAKLVKRLQPREAYEMCTVKVDGAPALLVDIRPELQRRENGGIPGALVVERNVLEWRFDPRCEARLDIANRFDLRVIIFCQEGYTSSLAAASLVEIGLLHATDIAGGLRAWKEAGLPTTDSDVVSDTDSLSQQ